MCICMSKRFPVLPRCYSPHASVSVTFLSNCHFLTPLLCFPPSCFLWLPHFISYVPVFISPPSSSPSHPCCRWHCGYLTQVEQHSALLCFCLNDLTSNIDRPCTPPNHFPPMCPSPINPSLPPLFSSLLPFPLPFSPAPFTTTFCLLALPRSSSLHFPSTLFFIPSGFFPRASTWSPWWLKGCPIVHLVVWRLKFFSAFHQQTLPFSPVPFSFE